MNTFASISCLSFQSWTPNAAIKSASKIFFCWALFFFFSIACGCMCCSDKEDVLMVMMAMWWWRRRVNDDDDDDDDDNDGNNDDNGALQHATMMIMTLFSVDQTWIHWLWFRKSSVSCTLASFSFWMSNVSCTLASFSCFKSGTSNSFSFCSCFWCHANLLAASTFRQHLWTWLNSWFAHRFSFWRIGRAEHQSSYAAFNTIQT